VPTSKSVISLVGPTPAAMSARSVASWPGAASRRTAILAGLVIDSAVGVAGGRVRTLVTGNGTFARAMG
jgi:hypothetical protein